MLSATSIRKAYQWAVAPLLLACCSAVWASDASCLKCHGDPAVAAKDAPQMRTFLVDAQQLAQSVHRSWLCIDCHEDIDGDVLPHREVKTPVDCMACHDPVGKTHRFHPRLALADPPPGEDTRCAACHDGHNMKAVKSADFAFARTQQTTSCGTCHQVEAEHFAASAHGRELLRGVKQAPDCLSCHREPEGWRNGDNLAQRKLAEVRQCEACHVQDSEVAAMTVLGAKFVESFTTSVHGRLLAEGREDAASCVDCHGAHEMNRAAVAGAQTAKLHVADTCAKCHEDVAHDYQTSVHAAGLSRGNLDSATCTDCHGEHDIRHHLDPTSRVHARNMAQQVCADCHSSVRLTERYGLSSHTFETFTDSYHGLAMRGGAVEVVNCASCHSAHAIKSHLDPTSTVHRENLLRTCGECHPGANDRFASGSVHVKATLKPDQAGGDTVLYWIATLYTWLIIVVIGGMIVHNLLDFVKKTRRKLAMQKGVIGEPYVAHRLYLRMTVHERLQHGVLVISFVLLVITGFMLRFPEAWWVQAIRSLSPHTFEWRSLIHRIAGVVMLVAGAWHIWYLLLTRPGRGLLRDLWPRWRDFTDPFKVLRFNLGLSPTKPSFGRFSYIEKTEYWAMVWGTILMGLTGVLLWFENTSIGMITKLGYDISRTVHYYEAILATLAIIFWHFYFVIFNPDVYPMNLSWLTGRMSEREMLEEHPAELVRLQLEAGIEPTVEAEHLEPIPLPEPPPGSPPGEPPAGGGRPPDSG